MPKCEMDFYVIFYILDGEGIFTVTREIKNIKSGQCMITESAELSLKIQKGMKLMGIQISKTD